MRIIPAIDLIDGKCVRLTQGDYTQKKIYNESPLDVAKEFEDAGLKYLKGLNQLEYLNLLETRVSAAAIKDLQKEVPNAQILK